MPSFLLNTQSIFVIEIEHCCPLILLSVSFLSLFLFDYSPRCGHIFLPLYMPINFCFEARYNELYVVGCWNFSVPLNTFVLCSKKQFS